MKRSFRIISAAAALCVIAAAFFSIPSAAAALKGDIDGDGEIKIADVCAALYLAAVSGEIDPETLSAADFDGDGCVTSCDARLILSNAVDLLPAYTERHELLDPEKNNGISKKASFVTPKDYNAQTLPESPINDKSDPRYADLPKGTVDYIKSGPVYDSESKKYYYVLRSGRRVYKDEVNVFEGYEQPLNTITLYEPPVYSETCTELYLALDWQVPFAVTVKPQSYVTGYDSRPFNLADDEFTGSFADITFYYTAEASGQMSFTDSQTLKACKWILNEEENTATLRVYFKTAGRFYGYTTYYNGNNYLVLSFKEPVTSLEGRTVAVDPGHGGAQPGANSGTGVDEKNLTWKIALQLKALLEKAGAKVILTRDNSKTAPEIEERRVAASEYNPDAFISIHLDASDSKSVHGSSVYYYKNYSGPLAFAVAKSLPAALKSELGYPLSNRGVHFYPFCVTRLENCPSVLVECGFITNTNSYFAKPTVGEKITRNTSLSMFKDIGEPCGENYPIIEEEPPEPSVQTASKTVYGSGCPYAEPSVNLSIGSTGSGVKWLQWHLYKLGYLASSAEVDGDFGSGTEGAVVRFQRAYGLDADGIAGPATRSALKSALSGEAPVSEEPQISSSYGCDFKMLNSANGQAAVAKGIYNGLLKYFGCN